MLFRLPIVKFFNRILNRITVTVVLVALQLSWLAWVFFALTTGTARVWVTGVLNGLSLLIILYLVRKDENSAYKVGWIALIGLLPLLGGALYLAFGNKRPSRRLRSKMQAVEQAHRADRAQQPGQTAGLCDENRGVSRYLTQYGCYPPGIFPAVRPCTRHCWPTLKRRKRASFWSFLSSVRARCGRA